MTRVAATVRVFVHVLHQDEIEIFIPIPAEYQNSIFVTWHRLDAVKVCESEYVPPPTRLHPALAVH